MKNYTGNAIDVYNYLNDGTDLTNVSCIRFLNRPEVQSALHVKKMRYNLVNDNVSKALKGDMYVTIKPWLEELLEYYGVMCYR